MSEGFAFFCWVRLSVAKYGGGNRRHDWGCVVCREVWRALNPRDTK